MWCPDRIAVVSADDSEVWLFGGAGPVRLAGRDAGPLARAVDGVRTLDDVIAAAADAGMPADAASRLAHRWRASGHLVDAVASAFAPSPPRVRLVDRSSWRGGATALHAALASGGVDVVDAHDVEAHTVLTVLLVDDLVECQDIPRSTLEGTPVMALQLSGDRALASPLLHPQASCPACLAHRVRTRRVADFVAATRVGLDVPPASPIRHAAAVTLAAGVVAAAAQARARGTWPSAAVARHVSVIDAVSGRIDQHALVPVPGCPNCDPQGPTVLASHLAGPLGAGPEAASSDTGGGLRVRDPEETWHQYAHLVSDVVGIVPYVVPTGRPELRAFSAGPNVAADDDLVVLQSRLRSSSGGKGLSLSAARTGALAEALERTSLRSRGSEPSRRARMADLENAIHPNAIQLFSEKQMHRAAQLRALDLADPAATGHHRVPTPFDVEAEHDWSPIADLNTGEVRWLPSSMVWFSWPGVPAGYPSGSSNGAAAGNTVTEAVLQGLLERVERDSVALWWHPRCHRPAFDLAAWDDPRIAAALAPQHAIGSTVWVLDLTSDLGVPAAAAVAIGVEPFPTTPLLGFGAHVDPVVAVVRALTELAQMQAPLTPTDGPPPLDHLGPNEQAWFAEVTLESEPWLTPHGLVDPPSAPDHRDVGEALDDLVDRVTARGLSVLWADCTRPDVGLPVVRTWAPGLRHFWNRYAPGRLYDVPPALGWCEPGYGEDDLNPRAMIL
jgi:ribosomal protein S12 methylthiotransferase accessory factor